MAPFLLDKVFIPPGSDSIALKTVYTSALRMRLGQAASYALSEHHQVSVAATELGKVAQATHCVLIAGPLILEGSLQDEAEIQVRVHLQDNGLNSENSTTTKKQAVKRKH